MATARPPGGGSTPTARLELDLSAFRNAPNVAREAGRATAREISNAFKTLQAEQKLAQTQANTTLAAIKAQQAQITATTRAESAQRMAAARAEAATQAQVARASAATTIEEERRKTAAFKTELRERERASRQSQVSSGSFASGAATFAGAAFGGPIGGLAGALSGGSLPLAAGLAIGQGARFAIEGEQLATAYDRQRVAAVSLAGSQAKLNELMETYRRAAGGAVYNADALADVTKLMGVGFADDSKELDQFARAIRGIALAMKTTEDTVTQNLVLELFSKRGQRLDQLGLDYQKVRVRADELRAADASLTQQQAYQNAVLDQARERYGALTESAEGQKTGVEKLTIAWRNLRLEMAQEIKPGVDEAANDLTGLLDRFTKFRELNKDLQRERISNQAIQEGRIDPFGPAYSRTSIGRTTPQAFGDSSGGASGFDPDQTAVMVNRQAALDQLNRGTRQGIDDVMIQGAAQRRQTIASYEKQSVREAEDFARQRLNNERKFALSLLDIAQDSARQRVKWEEELARNIAQAQADSAERVAELREDSSKRLVESEEKYAADREKRQRDHQKTLREAAANLDAVAVREEQRRFRDEAKEAKDAHDEQKRDIAAQLQERLDDEAKSLAKSEKQARDANQRRVEEQAANDALRIEEMKAAFEAQKIQEDEERGIRLQRQADDHAAQLTEMAAQQAERIQQIKDHAEEERAQIDKDYDEALAAVGIFTARYVKEHERVINEAILGHLRYVNALNDAWKQTASGHPSMADPYANDPAYQNQNVPSAVPPAAPALPFTPLAPWTPPKQTTIQGGVHVTIQAPASFAANEESRNWLYSVFADFFEEYEE